MGIYCTGLPKLPLSQPDAACSHATIPVVHMPSLIRDLRTATCESGLLQLVAHATKVYGLWRNACVLGVIAPLLHDIIEESWAMTA
ncbi:hypothetical protein B0H14DRAFT_3441817 [Mycena olivaceomarginata]|nr:hypothetical protein B0H14DRAFT_3441817 [Mycena olivaceomarginata]